jgi:hypothetical protein
MCMRLCHADFPRFRFFSTITFFCRTRKHRCQYDAFIDIHLINIAKWIHVSCQTKNKKIGDSQSVQVLVFDETTDVNDYLSKLN